jgi:hypothetical protein
MAATPLCNALSPRPERARPGKECSTWNIRFVSRPTPPALPTNGPCREESGSRVGERRSAVRLSVRRMSPPPGLSHGASLRRWKWLFFPCFSRAGQSQGRVAGTRDGIQPIVAQDVTVVHFLVQASLRGAVGALGQTRLSLEPDLLLRQSPHRETNFPKSINEQQLERQSSSLSLHGAAGSLARAAPAPPDPPQTADIRPVPIPVSGQSPHPLGLSFHFMHLHA